ncbi:hypothetical protein [Streptomyces sp. NPDC001903]|uniref:hypothetical protein n=1 Tax=Streptomyces sp. NPDC001903 TaxID=3364622 RepID=UPI00368E17B3
MRLVLVHRWASEPLQSNSQGGVPGQRPHLRCAARVFHHPRHHRWNVHIRLPEFGLISCSGDCGSDGEWTESRVSPPLWRDDSEPDGSDLDAANATVTKAKKKRDQLIGQVVDLIGYDDPGTASPRLRCGQRSWDSIKWYSPNGAGGMSLDAATHMTDPSTLRGALEPLKGGAFPHCNC